MTLVPCPILEVELSRPLPTVEPPADAPAVRLVFTRDGIPLGHEELSSDHLPLTPAQLAALASKVVAPALAARLIGVDAAELLPGPDARRLPAPDESALERLLSLARPFEALSEALRGALPPPGDSSVSVIVCTRDRPAELARCLGSLERSTRPPKEIIVVDNAPATTATRDVLRDHPRVRYVLEPRPGLSVARNAGIARASGDIIAFTDDDVVVHPEWTARVESAFDAPDVAAVTGLVLPAELRTEAQWTFEKDFGGFSQGYRELRFDGHFFRVSRRYGAWVWKVGAGASMAFRRHVFDELGTFDERLGAGASGCSEDSEMWYRVIARGWVCRYDPRAVVFHYHRDSLQSLTRQMHDYMRGHVTALFVQLQRHRHGGNLYRVLVTLPWHYFKMAVLEALHGFRPRHATLLAELRGCVAGVGYFLRHPRIPPRRSIGSEP